MMPKTKQKVDIGGNAGKITRWIGSNTSLLIHTLLFIGSLLAPVFNLVSVEKMLLVLTTAVSLEAIYLSIFIQMSINRHTEDIEELQEDIEEIREGVDELHEEDEDEIVHF